MGPIRNLFVKEVSVKEVRALLVRYMPKEIRLGSQHDQKAKKHEDLANSVLDQFSTSPRTRKYLFSWEGERFPQGQFEIEGHKIIFGQHGFVNSKIDPESEDLVGSHIGYRDRLVDAGGPSKDQHLTLIYVSPPMMELAKRHKKEWQIEKKARRQS